MTAPEVLIRPATLEDAEDLTELLVRNRDHFRSGEPVRNDDYYTVGGQRRVIDASLQGHDKGTDFMFLIDRDDRLIGRTNLSSVIRGAFQSASVGYVVDRAVSGQGVATEALRQVIEFAFGELDLHRLQAEVTPHNRASQRVLMHCGFLRYGRAPQYLQVDGRWQTHDLFQLINRAHDRTP